VARNYDLMTKATIKIIASVFALIGTICIVSLPLTFSHLPLDVAILRTTPISDTKISSVLEIWGEVTDILLAVAGWIVAVKLWKLNSSGRWLAMALLGNILTLMAAQVVLRPTDSLLSAVVIAVGVLLALVVLISPRANTLFGSVAAVGSSGPA
jgi:hypothetical protein